MWGATARVLSQLGHVARRLTAPATAGTGGPDGASRPRPDGALVATAPGPVGTLAVPTHVAGCSPGGARLGGYAMRQRLLSLTLVALVAAACGSSASGTGGPSGGGNQPPQHHGRPSHRATNRTRPGRRRSRRAGHRSRPRRGLDLRPRCRHRLVHDGPPGRRSRHVAGRRERPRRGVGQRLRPGLRAPTRRHLRHHRRRGPDAVPGRGRAAPAHRRRRPATCAIGPATRPR